MPRYLSCIQSGHTALRVMQGGSLENNVHSTGSVSREVLTHFAPNRKSNHGMVLLLQRHVVQGSVALMLASERQSRL